MHWLALERGASRTRRTCPPDSHPQPRTQGLRVSRSPPPLTVSTILPPHSLTPGCSSCPRPSTLPGRSLGRLGASWNSRPASVLPQPCPWGPLPAPRPSTHAVLTLRTPRASPVQVLAADSPGEANLPSLLPPRTPATGPPPPPPESGVLMALCDHQRALL